VSSESGGINIAKGPKEMQTGRQGSNEEGTQGRKIETNQREGGIYKNWGKESHLGGV
jgi:hypothetical protein